MGEVFEQHSGKIAWVLITILLALLTFMGGRESLGNRVSALETGYNVNKTNIDNIAASFKEFKTTYTNDITVIKDNQTKQIQMLSAHTGIVPK